MILVGQAESAGGVIGLMARQLTVKISCSLFQHGLKTLGQSSSEKLKRFE
jgi:hypothetical protein